MTAFLIFIGVFSVAAAVLGYIVIRAAGSEDEYFEDDGK